ncbi:hypothetical protein RB595_002065 [Gaeumannomyces hyphopodioides]
MRRRPSAPRHPQTPSHLIRSFNVDANPTRPMRPSPLTASAFRDMPLDIVDRIRSFPLFMSAPAEFLAAIGKHLRPQVHSPHDHILTEGDEARAMYWLVRGVVAVTSRDGEAVYAELRPGAFFGEIGVLMDMPRTATIVARSKCLLVVLKKEDLHAELPGFPDMEKAIRQEAQERLAILERKRQERGPAPKPRDEVTVGTGEVVVNSKKRKSPSPGVIEDPAVGGSALGSGYVNVRRTLRELPLFSALPPDILHFLGLSAIPRTFPPFVDIVQQGSRGKEIYFIVRGEAEVMHESDPARPSKPRLHAGQYFGEVASLGLSDQRTATVRSITTVECLVISGQALDELWRRCPPELKTQVEETARMRCQDKMDVEMMDTPQFTLQLPQTPKQLPQVTFTTTKPPSPGKESDTRQPTDPDPYLSVDMENLRSRRRSSLAPPMPQSDAASPHANGIKNHAVAESSPLRPMPPPTPPRTGHDDEQEQSPFKKARTLPRRRRATLSGRAENGEEALPDDVLVAVFQHLDLLELIRLRAVCRHWRDVLTRAPKLCTHVDLGSLGRRVGDGCIANLIAPFVGARALTVDIGNCFHITDEGFQALWKRCGRNVKTWRMKSVWEVSAAQILDMSENAEGLEEVDWSNCRKVGDNLLARVVGWVVPEPAPSTPGTPGTPGSSRQVVMASSRGRRGPRQAPQPPQNMPPPGTVIGCPRLRRLDLSYCKHITDRSMAHLAAHASGRLEALSLTRCTSITDAGFQAWAPHRFDALRRLCLADCTYLSDKAVVALVAAAKNLTHLDLSFCCALSDTATEVVALGLPQLRELRLAFCGSAVSDASLGCIALHLNELEGVSVRGCVRVTGLGVENVLEACARLRWLDVSQCKNLAGWLGGGGVERWGLDERGTGAARSAPPPRAGLVAGPRAGEGAPSYAAVASKPAWPRPNTPVPAGFRPVMRPIVLPKGVTRTRTRPPVRFIVEKGDHGLR